MIWHLFIAFKAPKKLVTFFKVSSEIAEHLISALRDSSKVQEIISMSETTQPCQLQKQFEAEMELLRW